MQENDKVTLRKGEEEEEKEEGSDQVLLVTLNSQRYGDCLDQLESPLVWEICPTLDLFVYRERIHLLHW